jgi:hypothetical protein
LFYGYIYKQLFFKNFRLVDIQVVVETWQLILGFIGFVITIISVTIGVCAFIYGLRERIKVLEVKIERQEKELNRFTNLFQDTGYEMMLRKSRGG